MHWPHQSNSIILYLQLLIVFPATTLGWYHWLHVKPWVLLSIQLIGIILIYQTWRLSWRIWGVLDLDSKITYNLLIYRSIFWWTLSRVNAVDVIYAAMPVYLYLNPNIIGYLLSPLLEYQVSQQYTNAYAAMDLGKAFGDPLIFFYWSISGGPFPNATGNYQSHNQEVERRFLTSYSINIVLYLTCQLSRICKHDHFELGSCTGIWERKYFNTICRSCWLNWIYACILTYFLVRFVSWMG